MQRTLRRKSLIGHGIALLLMTMIIVSSLAQFAENETQFLRRLGRAKDNLTVPGEGEIVQAIERGIRSTCSSSPTSDPLSRPSPSRRPCGGSSALWGLQHG